jgi:hypothetical protein
MKTKLVGLVLMVVILGGGLMVVEALWCYPQSGVDALGRKYVEPRGMAPQLHDFVNTYVFTHTHSWLEAQPVPTTKTLPPSTSSTAELLARADRLLADRVDPVVNVKK